MSRSAKKSAKGLKSNPPELNIVIPKLHDLPKDWSPNIDLPIDILLLTVKDCEFLSCYAHLSNPFKGFVRCLGAVYFGNVANDQDSKMKIGLMRCDEGPGSSLITVKNAITALQPKAAISVGYCSGLKKTETKLGDVVVVAKLTTYASKIVLDGQEQSTGQRFHQFIGHVADGWEAPLANREAREVKVHCTCEILSGPEKISANRRRDELVQLYPQAMAVEMEGEGLCAAAFDHGIEWLVVKGIADFGGESTDAPWQHFASVMAASVVFNLLRDAKVFSDWPHYKEITRDLEGEKRTTPVKEIPSMQEITRDLEGEKRTTPVKEIPSMQAGLIDRIRQLYISREGWLAPFPWCEEFHFHLDQIFATLKVVRREKTGGTLTANIVNMSEIFKPVEKCTQPRTVLIEGKPGMGKTTYCRKLAYDWATGKLWTSEKPRFLTVLMLRCCDIKSNLWEAIDDQLLPREVGEHTKESFFTFLRQNQSDVLLVLDGLDEVPTDELSVFKKIIQGRRDLPRCYVVATARQEAGIEVRIHADTLLQIEGFDDEDAKKFILQYFAKLSEKYAEKFWSEVTRDDNLKDMLTNPLHTALLCLDFDENEGSFPESKSQLYLDVAQCILRRYKKKKGLSETKEDVIEEFAVQLKHLGSLALNGLLEDKLNFEERELKDHGDGLPEFGFLSAQTGSKLRPSRRYSFQHKSFQEWFAAYFLSCQLMEKEISPESLVADKRYAHELKEVLPYTCGLLAAGCKAARCKEVAVTLTKRMMKEVNQGGRDGWLSVLLECTRECKQKDSSFQADLVRKLGSFLELETLKLHDGNLSAANVAVLADVLKSNTTVTELNLCRNDIKDAGVASLAGKLQYITTLKVLKLSCNGIGDAGAADLAGVLKFNTTLTELYFSTNCIGEAGAKCVADALKSNKTLTDLDLSFNEIGDAGAAALVDGLKSNTTLIVLYLSHNGISNVAKGLKSNTTLSTLNLSHNYIGTAGAAALTDLLKSTTTQSALNLAQYGEAGAAGRTHQFKFIPKSELYLSDNGIDDACTAGLADALKSNTTPTVLDLSKNSIADIAGVANGLKFNTTLTVLNLHGNQIGDDGAAHLAEGLKFNTTLTVLNLCDNKIGGAGAANLADGLKSNTRLSVLHLSDNRIGDDGAAHLADALESNETLTGLYLRNSGICDDGAAGLAAGLKSNTTLTRLWLSRNKIGCDGLTYLSRTLKCNKKLKVDLFPTESR